MKKAIGIMIVLGIVLCAYFGVFAETPKSALGPWHIEKNGPAFNLFRGDVHLLFLVRHKQNLSEEEFNEVCEILAGCLNIIENQHKRERL